MDAKQEIVSYCRRLSEKGFVAANDGNISVLLTAGTLLITPTNTRKGEVTADSLVSLELDGTVLTEGVTPSSESSMHLECYKVRDDITAVIHAHPPFATACSATSWADVIDEDILLPEILLTTGIIGTVAYHTPGSDELAHAVAEKIANHNGLLLKNHGVVAVGRDPSEAYSRLESIEMYCKVSLLAGVLGNKNSLSKEEVAKLLHRPSPEAGLR